MEPNFSYVRQGLNDRDPAFVGKCSDEMEYDEKCDGGSDTVEDEVCTFSFSYFLLLIIVVTASVYLIKVELMKLPKMLIRKLWNSYDGEEQLLVHLNIIVVFKGIL